MIGRDVAEKSERHMQLLRPRPVHARQRLSHFGKHVTNGRWWREGDEQTLGCHTLPCRMRELLVPRSCDFRVRRSREDQAQLKLKLTLIRSASTRLEATSWRSQLSKRITFP